jgi:group I intron endonuclease
VGCVYLVQNKLNDKLYVGMTTRTLLERMVGHLKGSTTASPTHFERALEVHGIKNFAYATLHESNDLEELYTKECEWIDKLNSLEPVGYNGSAGGHGGAQGPAALAKISAKLKGRQVSVEHRTKISATLTGRPAPKPVGHGAKVSAALKGVKKSTAACEAMSKAAQGRKRMPRDAETKAKISLSNKRFALLRLAKELEQLAGE